MLGGLREVESECNRLNIQFSLLLGPASTELPKFVAAHKIGGVVCDFSPLRVPQQWVADVRAKLPVDIAFCQVDAHNIVPVWVASEKQEYAARTIRNKINGKLGEYLTEFPAVIKHPYKVSKPAAKVNWDAAEDSLQVNMDVKEVKIISVLFYKKHKLIFSSYIYIG